MRVGVLTFHKCINYGSYWQARCLVEGLRRSGHEAELLDHDCAEVRRAELRCALQPKLPERTAWPEIRQYAAKVRRFARAIAGLPLSPSFALDEPALPRRYDAIVVGSDEVWNFRHPWYGSKPIFFGDGLDAERLVSFAASFGSHSAWDGIDSDWAGKLGNFAAISVRDENSWHLVRGGTGREAALVLDPCLHFPQGTHAERNGVEDYAVIYGHGFPAWLAGRVREWADRHGIRLVSIGYSNAFADEQRLGDGPVEFARAVAGARAVITNFFHGCIFALLHGKPWAATPSDYRAIKIPDLAATLATQHRVLDEHSEPELVAELLATPVEPQVEQRIGELRARGQEYLDAALA